MHVIVLKLLRVILNIILKFDRLILIDSYLILHMTNNEYMQDS